MRLHSVNIVGERATNQGERTYHNRWAALCVHMIYPGTYEHVHIKYYVHVHMNAHVKRPVYCSTRMSIGHGT